MTLATRDRWDVALHEAGHAVVAHLVGWKITEIIVNEPAADSWCFADPVKRYDDDDDHARDGICILLGGIAVDRRRDEATAPVTDMISLVADRVPWWKDLQQFGPLAQRWPHPDDDREVVEQLDRAAGLVAANWPAVEGLARVLHGARTVPSAEAHAIIDGLI